MNGKFFLAVLAGAVTAFLLGWLLWGILLNEFLEANSNSFEGLHKETPNLILMFLSNIVWAFLLAFIFVRWASISTFTGGLKAGAILGLLISLIYDLSFLSMMNLFNTKTMIVDVITTTIWAAIMGAVVGWILGIGKKAVAS